MVLQRRYETFLLNKTLRYNTLHCQWVVRLSVGDSTTTVNLEYECGAVRELRCCVVTYLANLAGIVIQFRRVRVCIASLCSAWQKLGPSEGLYVCFNACWRRIAGLVM